jgi:hypothetical protein
VSSRIVTAANEGVERMGESAVAHIATKAMDFFIAIDLPMGKPR